MSTSDIITEEWNAIYSITDYVLLLISKSPTFNKLLKEHGITERLIKITGEWIEKMMDQNIELERWWSGEHLSRIPGIGKDWSYGQTYVLERFGHFVGGTTSLNLKLYKHEVETLESILVKSKAANAIILGENDASRMAIIQSLAAMINNGTSYPVLENKKVFLIDSLSISQSSRNAEQFENTLSGLLNEAYRVGNIILIIDNFSIFLDSATNLGVDAMAILVPYFRSSSIQFVTLSDSDEYYKKLQIRREIIEHFELVRSEIKDDDSLIRIVEDEALYMEYKNRVFYTTEAIVAIAESAGKYFSSDDVTNKAIDLTLEAASINASQKRHLITRSDILHLVESKTGIPTGEINEAEKNKLLNLDNLLKQRVVGQDEAVTAISQALRRSRSGLAKANKPMGSFLF